MTEILLSSETFVKQVTNISDNIAGKYILSALRDAQEIKLRGILGSCLLDSVKTMRANNELTGMYLELVNQCQYYLAYQTIVEMLPLVTYKVGNFGLSKSTDENMQVADADELARQITFYQSKADAYCMQLQEWIWDNRSSFTELSSCDCERIKANLYSAATCGVFLGGARGKRMKKDCCR